MYTYTHTHSHTHPFAQTPPTSTSSLALAITPRVALENEPIHLHLLQNEVYFSSYFSSRFLVNVFSFFPSDVISLIYSLHNSSRSRQLFQTNATTPYPPNQAAGSSKVHLVIGANSDLTWTNDTKNLGKSDNAKSQGSHAGLGWRKTKKETRRNNDKSARTKCWCASSHSVGVCDAHIISFILRTNKALRMIDGERNTYI